MKLPESEAFRRQGYVVVDGLVESGIMDVTAAFDSVLRSLKNTSRNEHYQFIERNTVLGGLVDHVGIRRLLASVLGPNFVYIGSRGSVRVGSTAVHTDYNEATAGTTSVLMYLDGFGPGDSFVVHADGDDANLGPGGGKAIALRPKPGDVLMLEDTCLHSVRADGTRRLLRLLFRRAARTIQDLQRQQLCIDLEATMGAPIKRVTDRASLERSTQDHAVVPVETFGDVYAIGDAVGLGLNVVVDVGLCSDQLRGRVLDFMSGCAYGRGAVETLSSTEYRVRAGVR